MAVLDIKIIPDPILRVSTASVETFDATLHRLLDDMYDTILSANGLGLAAPQVGIDKRLAIMDLSIDEVPQPKVTSLSGKDPSSHIHQQRLEMINPKILNTGPLVSSNEGCLSIPDYRDSIKRASTIVISSFDRYGNQFQVEATELTAFCIQHEMDHLDGILFVDHLSRLKKQLFRRWCNKTGLEYQERG